MNRKVMKLFTIQTKKGMSKMSTKKKTDVKSVKKNVNGEARSKKIKDNENKPEKVYLYDEIFACRFVETESGDIKFEFTRKFVEATEDLSNYPDKVDTLRKTLKRRLHREGNWYFSDDRLISATLEDLEEYTDQSRHDAYYNCGDFTKSFNQFTHIRNVLRAVNERLSYIRNVKRVLEEDGIKEFPKIIPPIDRLTVKDNHIVVTDPKPLAPTPDDIDKMLGLESIDINSKEVPEKVRELAKVLGNYVTVHIARLPNKAEKK